MLVLEVPGTINRQPSVQFGLPWPWTNTNQSEPFEKIAIKHSQRHRWLTVAVLAAEASEMLGWTRCEPGQLWGECPQPYDQLQTLQTCHLLSRPAPLTTLRIKSFRSCTFVSSSLSDFIRSCVTNARRMDNLIPRHVVPCSNCPDMKPFLLRAPSEPTF